MPHTELREYGHEQVIFINNEEANLKAIIAIHDTTLGPALGGCRMWPYPTEAEAITDVLRLSRGMSYKAAAAGLNLGGGKAVIIGDSKKDKSEALFRAFGRAVEACGGRYITAEDVGTDVNDMEYAFMETGSVTGVDTSHGGSGDPSPFTALGVLQGMRAASEMVYGENSFKGRHVAIEGVGHVGGNLVKLLAEEGAHVTVCDIDQEKIDAAREAYPKLDVVGTDEIYDVAADIFAPCALGASINEKTVERLKCKIIAGAANNQLATDEIGLVVNRRGILYAPDYVINAGGLINVSVELEGYSRERALRLTRGIYYNTLKILRRAKDEGIPSNQAADRQAELRIRSIGRVRNAFSFFRRGRNGEGKPFSR